MRKVKSLAKVQYLAPDVSTKIIPSPTDGWDAISPLAEMDPKRAPILDNWVPRPGYVELRKGYTAWAKVSTSPTETLMVYRSPTGETLFAASGTSIYDVSTYGTNPAVLTALSSARWQYINFTPGNGTTVIQLCNGVDTLRQWDGTVWTVPGVTGLPGGRTTADIINIASQKRRIWYILKNSSIAAFMPTDAITGAIAGSQDLGALWTKGGYLVGMAAWTLDGGSGPQDYAMFLSSRGQVTIYSGTDPTNASLWNLVGTFDIAPPISRRCFLRVGSDVAIITQQGVLPISQALPFDPSADRSVAITARIQNAMATASQTAKDMFGWQLISYPNEQLAILNVPVAENSQQVQFVMNALTGAWCRFTGWNANCFEIFNDGLYWGGNTGEVNLGYVGLTDNGSPLSIDMQCAFNWFEEPGKIKRMTMIQPLLTVDGSLTMALSVDADFQTSTAVDPITFVKSGSLWDVALWDVAVWDSGAQTYTSWLSVDVIGHALAVRSHSQIAVANPGALSGFDLSVFDLGTFDGSTNGTSVTLRVNAFNSIIETGGVI